MCPHGCGQTYPRHLLQSHQTDECPQRPFHLQLETVERRLTQKYELLQQQLLEYLEQQEKKHEEDKKELQQQLAQTKALIQQLTGTNNALTLHPVGSIGPCGVSLVDCMVDIFNFLCATSILFSAP